MSLIRVELDYDSNFWLEDYNYHSRTIYSGVVVDIASNGINLSVEVELSKDDKINIANGLHNAIAPHWQNIPVTQHQVLIDISRRIYEVTDRVDMALRAISKCYRLPMPQYSKFYLNQQPHCDVMTWVLNDEDRLDLAEVLGKKQEHTKVVSEKFIILPFPINYERKPTYLNPDELAKFELLVGNSKVVPYKQMYAEAYARFTARQHDATVLLLATALETALKSYISEKGGSLLQYMLDKMASPSLENLLIASVDYCGLNAPKDFKKWIVALRIKRNEIAHKPTITDIDPLEVGRWIGIAEAIFSALEGEVIDDLIGSIISPVGEKAMETFPKGTLGVVLRMEPYVSMPPYHVLMSTGETYRMNKTSFEIITRHKFNAY